MIKGITRILNYNSRKLAEFSRYLTICSAYVDLQRVIKSWENSGDTGTIRKEDQSRFYRAKSFVRQKELSELPYTQREKFQRIGNQVPKAMIRAFELWSPNQGYLS